MEHTVRRNNSGIEVVGGKIKWLKQFVKVNCRLPPIQGNGWTRQSRTFKNNFQLYKVLCIKEKLH